MEEGVRARLGMAMLTPDLSVASGDGIANVLSQLIS
jgi:hypothetical protein